MSSYPAPSSYHAHLPPCLCFVATGTLVATMLSRLYGLSYTLALRHTQAYHDSRVYPQGVRSPQTAVQRAQVGGGGSLKGCSLVGQWDRQGGR